MNSHGVYHLNETSYSSQYFCHCPIFLSVFYRIKFRIFLIFFTLARLGLMVPDELRNSFKE